VESGLSSGRSGSTSTRSRSAGQTATAAWGGLLGSHPRVQPADLGELLDRAATKAFQTEVVLVRVLGEVGMQPDIQPLGQLCGRRHQFRTYAAYCVETDALITYASVLCRSSPLVPTSAERPRLP
jgi:hypothetical protein